MHETDSKERGKNGQRIIDGLQQALVGEFTARTVFATPRKKISRHTRAVVFLRQGGRCAKCQAKLFRPYIIDHVIQLWMGGADHPDNMQAVCRPCDAPKTAKDAGSRAKVKRIIKAEAGEKASSRPIQSRGFDKTKSRGFDGKVHPRKAKETSR